jgi:hypothetical protein
LPSIGSHILGAAHRPRQQPDGNSHPIRRKNYPLSSEVLDIAIQALRLLLRDRPDVLAKLNGAKGSRYPIMANNESGRRIQE